MEIIVNKGNHPQMTLIQVSEILSFAHVYIYIYRYICTYPPLLVIAHVMALGDYPIIPTKVMMDSSPRNMAIGYLPRLDFPFDHLKVYVT